MKQLVIAVCLLCLLATPYADAGMVMGGGVAATGAPSCTTSNDAEIVANTTSAANGSISTTDWIAQQFTITSGTIITTWSLRGQVTAGSPTGNLICSLYSAGASNKPGSEISGSQVSVAINTMATDVDAFFDLATPKTINDTIVHVVCRIGAGGSGTIYNRESSSSVYAGGIKNTSSNSGSTWSNDTAIDEYMAIYGCTP